MKPTFLTYTKPPLVSMAAFRGATRIIITSRTRSESSLRKRILSAES